MDKRSEDKPATVLSEAAINMEAVRLRSVLAAEVATRHGIEFRLEKLQSAYARFVPPQLLGLLGKNSILEVDWGNQVEKKMTILFSDIRGFTSISEHMSPQHCFDLINGYLSAMEPLVLKHGGFIDKYIGDSVMALFPARGDDALQAALGMHAQLQKFNQQLAEMRGEHPERYPSADIKVGIGMNSGLLMLGVIGGANRMEVTVISDAVNLASRVETLTKIYGTPILITQHTANSIRYPGDFSIRFIDRVKVRGKLLAQSIYEVFDADSETVKAAKLETLALFEDALAHFHYQLYEQAQQLFAQCVELNPGDTTAAVYLERCQKINRSPLPPPDEDDIGLMYWQPAYLLNFAGMDDMHQVIFDHITKLVAALRQESLTVARDLVGKLTLWTTEHFESEERLMEAHDYPRSPYLEHCQQHRKFLQYLEVIANDIGSGEVSTLRLAFRCQFQMLDWFVSHINIADRHLERHIHNNQSGNRST